MLPGLLIAAALSGGFYVLLVAAGVRGRGRSVAYAALSGAALQVASTALLQQWVGLQAVGIGAALGQGLALIMLVVAVGGSVHRGREAVLVMCLGAAAAIVLQGLNAIPDATVLPRFAVAGACALFGAMIGTRYLQQRAAILSSTVDACSDPQPVRAPGRFGGHHRHGDIGASSFDEVTRSL